MSKNNIGVPQGQRRPHFVIVDHPQQSVPITIPPQCFSRNHSQFINHLQPNSESQVNSFNNGRPVAHSSKTSGQNIKSWLKNENSKLVSQENIIINLDNISEPSSSHALDSYRLYSSRLLPEQCQLDVSAVESTANNFDQNLPNEERERNTNEGPYSDDFENYNASNSNNTVTENNAENPNLRTNSGNYSIDKFFHKYVPFIGFLLLKAIYDHREGILIFIGLLVTFIHANSVIKREVAKQSRRSLLSLGIIFINLFVSICLIYFVFQDQHLYKNLIFIPPYSQPLTLWDVLWIVGITDFVLKFITIQLKVGLACFPAKLLPYSARGKWYLVLERGSQLYRGLTPIQPWLYYLMEVYKGPENVVGMFFSVAYVISKGSDIMSKVKLFLKAFLKLLQNASFGSQPSKEQLVSAGSQCPICHDDYMAPVILQCRHIFCESCVSVWFDREQTCPLCRAKIADDPSWRDGSTSPFTQLF